MHSHLLRRLRPLLSGLFIVLLLAAIAQSAMAQAGLKSVGPIDPVSGYPLWYEDHNGLKLGLCTDTTFCFFELPDGTQPASFPSNWPDELFYWAADALMSGANGERARLVLALEGAFAQGPVIPGDQMVFARVRVRLSGMVPGATYTVTHPYGIETVVAENDGSVFITRDIGIGVLGDFSGALKGDIGPFLLPVGFAGEPGEHFGNAIEPIKVEGSPLLVAGAPANYFQIDGPGAGTIFANNSLGADRAQQTLFAMQGVVASQFGVQADQVSYSMTSTATSVNIWASSAAGQSLVASIDGSVNIPLTENVAIGGYFLRAELGATAAPPTTLTLTNTLDIPATSITIPIPDHVMISSAVYTIGGDLVVSATSSDRVGGAVISAEIDEGDSAILPGTGNGDVSGGLNLPTNTIAPQSVRVWSSAGGSASVSVVVEGMGTNVGGGAAVIANAGPDQSVSSGANVGLEGGGSLGPIVSYLWLHDAGALITLVNPLTANPNFIAPGNLVGGLLDITFTLTVFDVGGLSTSDTIVVHVSDPVAPASDLITVVGARYEIRKESWRVDGTAAVLQNQTVDVYIGNILGPDLGRKIGEAIVNAVGAFRYRGGNGSAAASGSIPIAGDTHVWAISRLPGTAGSLVFRVK